MIKRSFFMLTREGFRHSILVCWNEHKQCSYKSCREQRKLVDFQHFQMNTILLLLLFKACLYIGFKKVTVAFPYMVVE